MLGHRRPRPVVSRFRGTTVRDAGNDGYLGNDGTCGNDGMLCNI